MAHSSSGTDGPTDLLSDPLILEYCKSLRDCRRFYHDNGTLIVGQYPELAWKEPKELMRVMEDLHSGLLVKVYFTMSLADQKWTARERVLAQLLIEHVWNRTLEGKELKDACLRLSAQATSLSWYSLIRPFADVAPLRERASELEALIIRMANVVAKIDGKFAPSEELLLRSIQHDLELHLRPLGLDAAVPHGSQWQEARQAVQSMQSDIGTIRSGCELDSTQSGGFEVDKRSSTTPSSQEQPSSPPEKGLEELMAELQSLIGLQSVKSEITTLANLLQLQQQRAERGLPRTDVSLHMVFTGNPGTGKTTVARLVAQLSRAMNILKKGHLVETDRSGLVAEYAGQTGPKTNRRVDEALDGVLFIDEAYSLVSQGDDAFGREALQALLKRMEDERDRLVVILAGYPEEMKELLQSNPGLSSRFNRHLQFDDYQPVQLAMIYHRLCNTNQFQLPAVVRARLLMAFQWMYDNRDEHFGNGRTARNMFEVTVRRLANRIAGAGEITHELLTTFDAADLEFESVPAEILGVDPRTLRFQVTCPNCDSRTVVGVDMLHRRVRCKCGHKFTVEWGEPMSS